MLIDLEMPEMDGPSALREIRRFNQSPLFLAQKAIRERARLCELPRSSAMAVCYKITVTTDRFNALRIVNPFR